MIATYPDALPSRYSSHSQQTLRCLHLKTPLENSKNLVTTFITFLPHLVEVSIEVLFISLPSHSDNKSKGFDPDLLLPLKGSLRLRRFRDGDDPATEPARLLHHFLLICGATVWTGVQEPTTASAPTL